MSPLAWVADHVGLIAGLTGSHLWLTVLPTVVGFVLSMPLGYLAYTYRKTHTVIVGGTSLFYTIPSLVLFVLLPRILGTPILSPVNVVVALTVYTIALMVRVIADGLSAVQPDTIDVAHGMGFTRAQTFFKVELPIAIPTIVAGLRVVVVSNISIVTVAALVGISQLGSLFTMGFTRRLLVPIIVGLIVCTLLSIILDRLLVMAGHLLTPWDRRGAM